MQQNKYYWGCLLPMVQEGLNHAGYNEVKTPEDAHEVLKHLFLKKKIVNQNTDETIEIAGSTQKLTTVQFNEFVDEVIRWAAAYLSIAIPLPNESLVMFADYDNDVNATIVQPETV
ncbi:MAG: hypothetical protein JST87_05455 [Bacteroidetes bacterium]|nr:hypothetical protein [Bacteroidota bacterium]